MQRIQSEETKELHIRPLFFYVNIDNLTLRLSYFLKRFQKGFMFRNKKTKEILNLIIITNENFISVVIQPIEFNIFKNIVFQDKYEYNPEIIKEYIKNLQRDFYLEKMIEDKLIEYSLSKNILFPLMTFGTIYYHYLNKQIIVHNMMTKIDNRYYDTINKYINILQDDDFELIHFNYSNIYDLSENEYYKLKQKQREFQEMRKELSKIQHDLVLYDKRLRHQINRQKIENKNNDNTIELFYKHLQINSSLLQLFPKIVNSTIVRYL